MLVIRRSPSLLVLALDARLLVLVRLAMARGALLVPVAAGIGEVAVEAITEPTASERFAPLQRSQSSLGIGDTVVDHPLCSQSPWSLLRAQACHPFPSMTSPRLEIERVVV